MTATLTNADGSKRIVLDGEIVVGAGLDYGPLPDGKAWLDATGGAGAGMGGYPAAFFLALENATGLLGIEHIEPGGEHGVLYVSSGLPTWGLIMDANVSAVAAIDFSKIDSPTTLAGYGITDAASDVELAAAVANAAAYTDGEILTVLGTDVEAFPTSLARGAIVYSVGTGDVQGLSIGAAGTVLKGTGAGNLPSYGAIINADVDAAAGIAFSKLEGGSGHPANNVLASPDGSTGALAVRALVPADIPSLASTKISDFAAAVGAIAQPLDADLTLLAGITLAANEFIARSSAGAVAAKPITDFGLSLVDDADAAAARTTLGLVIGTNVQAYDATLAALAGVTSTAGGMLYSTGADAFSNLANPGATSVLTHNATIPVWVSALAKAQHHVQTAFLDGTSPFSTTQTVPTLIINGTAGTSRDVIWRTSGVSRWLFRVNGTAEGVSNVGSDVEIQSRDDAGALIGVAVGIKRSDMTVTFAGPLVAQSTLVLTGTATLNGTLKHNGATLGFYGVTAVARPAAITQTYASTSTTHSNLTATALTAASGTADGTVDDVGAAFNQTTLNNNFKEVATQSNSLRTDLTNVKQVINYVIDCLQSQGLLQ